MQNVVRELQATIEQFDRQVKLIPANELSCKPAPGKWSGKEIIGHLVDSAQNNIQRFVRAQYQPNTHIVYDQVQWVSIQNYQEYPVESLVQLWKALNKHICFILTATPPEMYERTCNTGTQEAAINYTVRELAEDYVTHLLHHIKQIIP